MEQGKTKCMVLLTMCTHSPMSHRKCYRLCVLYHVHSYSLSIKTAANFRACLQLL